MKISRITWRIVLTSIIFGFLLCILIVMAGFRGFDKNFHQIYNSMLESISTTALDVVDAEKVEYYQTEPVDNNYEYLFRVLNALTENFDLNFIYVSCVSGENYTHIQYIFDTVRPGSGWTPYPKGYEEDYFDKSYNQNARKVYESGEKSLYQSVSKNSGSHITCMIPVKDRAGKVIAILGVEKDIQEYVDSVRSYLMFSCVIAVILTVLIVGLLIFFSNLQIIFPLLKISDETERFKKHRTANEGWNNSIRSNDEISDLAKSISGMEKNIIESVENLTKLTAEKERVSTQLDVARKIQMAMLPAKYPPFPERNDFDLFATMNPALEVGGDFYDYQLLDKDHLMLVVGDVSGKGIPASLFMAITRALIETRAMEGFSPAQIAQKTNVQICKHNAMTMFVTCWLGILNLKTGELKFVNAAHPYPVLNHGGKVDFVQTKPNIMFGAMEDSVYEEHSIMLEKGDRLFVYTDGVTEATNDSKELFGSERTLAACTAAARAAEKDSAADVRFILSYIKNQIDGFVKDAPQFDDITMLEFEKK